jgi:hypothetical protein
VWRISNLGHDPMSLKDAWVPHGRFRGNGHVTLNTNVHPGESALIELYVSASEPPGTVVQNAYLILRTPAGRLFARMRVDFDAGGVPHPVVEMLTTQSLQ